MTFFETESFLRAADFIGIIGVFFYLTSYTLLQMGHLRGGSFAYTMMNLAAASFVLISLASRFNFSSLLIQVFWISVSLYTLAKLFSLSRSRAGTARDRRWAAELLPQMDQSEATAILSVADFEETREDLMLLRQGAPVRALYFITEGRASIEIDGRKVREVMPGEIVGEFGIWEGEDASATVRMIEPGSVYRFDRAEFLAQMQEDHALETNVHRLLRRLGVERLMRSTDAIPSISGQKTPA
ncbi:MAG: cyclic nucleotide-binding domain-containing protein [Pseudomonadota bacterium]